MPEPTHEDFRDAYSKSTGDKVGRVPHQWFDIFPNLRKTPAQKAREGGSAASTNPTPATPASDKKEK